VDFDTPNARNASGRGGRTAAFKFYEIPDNLSVTANGAKITLLKVTAGRNVRVQVRCQGRGCPIQRRSRTAGRIRALERYLAAGTRITIRVRRPGYIGKYARIVIRGGGPPSRRDACLLPGNSRPVVCPLARRVGAWRDNGELLCGLLSCAHLHFGAIEVMSQSRRSPSAFAWHEYSSGSGAG
jgi:hypothetical protein